MGRLGRRGAACAFAVVAIANGACGNPKPQGAAPASSASPISRPTDCAAPSATAEITASKSLFDKACVSAGAQKPLKLTFHNTDNYQHNFAVLKQAGGEKIFASPFLDGEAETVIEIPAMPPGKYRFECNIHPAIMEGDYVVK